MANSVSDFSRSFKLTRYTYGSTKIVAENGVSWGKADGLCLIFQELPLGEEDGMRTNMLFSTYFSRRIDFFASV